MNKLGIFFLLYLKVCLISCQSEQCIDFLTCGECIGYALENCVWCSAKNYEGRRCTLKSSLTNLTEHWCEGDVYDPKPYNSSTSEKNFNDGKNGLPIVQFRPQSMDIKARPGVPIDIKMSYKPAKDYPLDIYYLIDYSSTMAKYAEVLRNQGLKIYEELTNTTNNVRFGIGSFVEKPDMPFVDTSTQKSYSFQHHLSLTENMTSFSDTLNYERPVGSNNDKPEAGLDALMQAMTCEKEIGWRHFANRIIIVSTDSTYHSVGDGKFVGAFKPHDMQCHLVDNEYAKALELDYPSVTQINKVARDNNFMIIFAVTSDVKDEYKVLETKIQNAKYVHLSDKYEVVDMIVTEYKKLVSSVILRADIPPFMNLVLDPDCTIKDTCLYSHDPIEIVGTLTVNSCPKDNFKHSVKIGPASLDEKLLLNIEILCRCECEKPGKGEQNSEYCSRAGTYQCGVCSCNEDSYGDTCNCNKTSIDRKDFDKCKAHEHDSNYCSGRGTCSCGKCVDCQKGFSGDFCEFDDNSCPRPGGLQCSGRGKCSRGKCECDPHWLPDDCQCPDDEGSCIGPYSKEPCSGRGECKCGECICNRVTTANEYCSGRYCDECEEFAAERCKDLEGYAYCNFKLNKTECDLNFTLPLNITNTEVHLVNKTEMYSPTWYMAKMWCKKVLENDQVLVFKYHYRSSLSLLLIIQNELDMPPVPDILIAVGSVIGAVLLIGIITIIAWKILVDIHDKREYEKFAKDSAAAGYDVSLNPLYQSPATNFTNPSYCG